MWLERSWGGELRNVSPPVAIGVNEEGFCGALGVAEGSKEAKANGTAFQRRQKERGLLGVRLIVSEEDQELVEIRSTFLRQGVDGVSPLPS